LALSSTVVEDMFISSASGSAGYVSIYPLPRAREGYAPAPGDTANKSSNPGADLPLVRGAIAQVAGSEARLQAGLHQDNSTQSNGTVSRDGKSPGGGPQSSAGGGELAGKVQRALIAFTIGVGSPNNKNSGNALESFIKSLPSDVRQRWESFVNGEIISDPATTAQAANQVANLALGDYPSGGTAASTQQERDARQQFADQVTPLIDQGFQAASATVGSLPDTAQQTLRQIHALVLDQVNSFVGVDRTV
jgi:hypothetical protein